MYSGAGCACCVLRDIGKDTVPLGNANAILLQERFAYKMRVLRCLSGRMQRLRAQGRHVAIVGDFNIAPTPLDHCDPSPEFAQRGDRRWLAALLSQPHSWRAAGKSLTLGEAAVDAACTPKHAADRADAEQPARCSICEHLDAVPPVSVAELSDASPASGAAFRRTNADGISAVALPCGGFADTFRWFHAGRAAAYTCWNTASGARNNNWGTRIDLVLVADPHHERSPFSGAAAGAPNSTAAQPVTGTPQSQPPDRGTSWRWRDAAVAGDIMAEFRGSDHAPAWLEVDLARMPPLATPPPRAPPLPQSSAALLTAHGKQSSLSRLWSGASATKRAASGALGSSAAPAGVAATQQSQVKRAARGPAKQARLLSFVSAAAPRPPPAAGGPASGAGAASAPKTAPASAAQAAATTSSQKTGPFGTSAACGARSTSAPAMGSAWQAAGQHASQISAPVGTSLPPSQSSVNCSYSNLISQNALAVPVATDGGGGNAALATATHLRDSHIPTAGTNSAGAGTNDVAAASSNGTAHASAEVSQRAAASQAAAAARWREIQGKFKPIKCSGHGEECVMRQVRCLIMR